AISPHACRDLARHARLSLSVHSIGGEIKSFYVSLLFATSRSSWVLEISTRPKVSSTGSNATSRSYVRTLRLGYQQYGSCRPDLQSNSYRAEACRCSPFKF